MRWQLLDIEQCNPMRGKDSLSRRKGIIEIVFLVYRVELIALDQVYQVRELNRDHATFREQDLHPRNKIVEVGHVRENIVGRNQIRMQSFGNHLARHIGTEILLARRYADLSGCVRYLFRRLDPQAAYSALNEILEQITVAGCQLHDETRG